MKILSTVRIKTLIIQVIMLSLFGLFSMSAIANKTEPSNESQLARGQAYQPPAYERDTHCT